MLCSHNKKIQSVPSRFLYCYLSSSYSPNSLFIFLNFSFFSRTCFGAFISTVYYFLLDNCQPAIKIKTHIVCIESEQFGKLYSSTAYQFSNVIKVNAWHTQHLQRACFLLVSFSFFSVLKERKKDTRSYESSHMKFTYLCIYLFITLVYIPKFITIFINIFIKLNYLENEFGKRLKKNLFHLHSINIHLNFDVGRHLNMLFIIFPNLKI